VGVEVVLFVSDFEQVISMVFVVYGVYQLKKGQDTGDSDMKNFSPTFRALEMYDVEKLYVEEESMEQRGLNSEDLLVPVEVLSSSEIAGLMEEQDVLLNF
jgi:tRNA 2-thiouridine synthesizing protein C